MRVQKPIITGMVCASLLYLTGCAGSVAPSLLEPPAKVLMSPSPKLADPKEGDDLVQEHIAVRRAYITETSKYARLQRWVKTVLGK